MPRTPAPPAPRPAAPAASDTAGRLLAAAAAEFNEHGFLGTDSNRIARRAGFAPQTFYRRFADKTAIFVAVYRQWQDDELAVLQRLAGARAAASRIAERVIAHHRATRIFRRSLRQLAIEDATVRAARADSRKRQIEAVRALGRGLGAEAIAPLLLQIERLCDAVAEGELDDLGLDDRGAREAIAALIDRLRGG
ncbi:MAG: helix-turn-helix domain-containing protein [Reyranellaceae bacterium]